MLSRALILACAALTCPTCTALGGELWTLEVKLDDRTVRGAPVAWTANEVHLLGRDGRLWTFPPAAAGDARQVSDTFTGLTAVEMRDALRREFGQKLEVTGTGHYLVVHPVGQGEYWSQRFEDLYRAFLGYFSVRGHQVTPPKFPLVAVVFANQSDFLRAAAAEGMRPGPGVLGYYSVESNRVLLFDVSGGRNQKKAWYANAETIVHEATHQTAFNTGVHSRLGDQPTWVVEGLGTLFEVSSVWSGDGTTTAKDRVNRSRRDDFRQYLKSRRQSGSLVELVATDRLFRTDPLGAYAEAWALSYYLSETQGRKYAAFLAKTAARPAFQSYSAEERLTDFRAAFGDDIRLFEAKFLRFLEDLE